MTTTARAVLEQALKTPDSEWYGLQMATATGLATGTLYPILARIVKLGWVTTRWEDPAAYLDRGRPPRRYYRLTPAGAGRARDALEQAAARRRRLSAAEPGPWA